MNNAGVGVLLGWVGMTDGELSNTQTLKILQTFCKLFLYHAETSDNPSLYIYRFCDLLNLQKKINYSTNKSHLLLATKMHTYP